MKSFKQFLPESFLVELTEVPNDSASPLGGGAEMSATPSANELARTENELQIDDLVKITGNVNHRGEKGKVTNFGSNKAFVVVQLNGKDYSFHTSDVTLCDDDDEIDRDDDDDDFARMQQNIKQLRGF